jgi:hypothetical protein
LHSYSASPFIGQRFLVNHLYPEPIFDALGKSSIHHFPGHTGGVISGAELFDVETYKLRQKTKF